MAVNPKLLSTGVIVLLLAGLVTYMAIRYVPGKKDYEKAETKQQVLRDTINVRQAERDRLARQLVELTRYLRAVNDRAEQRQGLLIDATAGRVSGMDSTARQLATLTYLIQHKLLDSAHVGKADKEDRAMLRALMLCDTMEQDYKAARLQLAVTERQSDTLAQYRSWAIRAKQIATQKGILTGRNKALRQHTTTNTPQ